MTDFVKAIQDPAGTYAKPVDVLTDNSLTSNEKIMVLEQWEYEAIALQTADGENMEGAAPAMLSRVHNALYELKHAK